MRTDITNMHIEGPRGCTPDDRGEVLALIDSILRIGSKQSLATDYPLVYRDDNLENVQIIRANAKLVAVVPFIPWTVRHEGCELRVGIISPTGTYPEFRGHGFGLKCLNSCIECMNNRGIELSVLWTLVPTFRFYNRGGFQAVKDQGSLFTLTRNQAGWFQDRGETIESPGEVHEYLPAIQRLRHAEPVGLLRNDDRAAVLHNLPLLTTYVALRDGEPVAYLTYSQSSNKGGVTEAAGDEFALETIMHRLLKAHDTEAAVQIFCPLCDTNLSRMLDRVCHSEREPCLEGTMFRINDVRGLFQAVSTWLERRAGGQTMALSITVTDTNETVSLEFNREGLKIGDQQQQTHFDLSRLELTSAIFGAHPCRPFDAPEPVASLFPFHFPISILDRS